MSSTDRSRLIEVSGLSLCIRDAGASFSGYAR